MGAARRPNAFRVAAIAAAAIVTSVGGTAEARKRVVIIPFDGPGAAKLENGITAILRESNTVLPADEFLGALDEMGLRADNDQGVARAARQMGADAVIRGKVKKIADEWELQLTIRNGADGAVVEEMSIPLPKPGERDERARSRAKSDLDAALSHTKAGAPDKASRSRNREASDGEGAEAEPERDEARQEAKAKPKREAPPEPEEPAEKPPAKKSAAKADKASEKAKEVAAEESAPRKIARKGEKAEKAEKASESDSADAKDAAVDTEEVKVTRSREPSDEGPGFLTLAWRSARIAPRIAAAHAGVAIVSHNFSYDNAELQGHTGSSPGFVVGLEAYPLQLFKLGRLDNLGVAGSFSSQPFGKTANATTDTPTAQKQWRFDARYAFKMADNILLIPSAGLGQHFFFVANKRFIVPSKCTTMEPMICVANVIATYVHLGGEARIAFSQSVTVDAHVNLLPVLRVDSGTGDLASEASDFAFGLGTQVGVAYAIKSWIAVRAGFDFTYFRHTLAPPDGVTAGYGSAKDSYTGGSLTGEYRY